MVTKSETDTYVLPVTCDPQEKLDRVPLSAIEPFQGSLKSLGDVEYGKLRQSMLEKGCCGPVFAWRNGTDKWKLLDGHQRVRVIEQEKWKVEGIPVVEIDAADEKDAKEKLLAIVSRYGRVDGQGLYDFLDGTGIDLEEWTVPDLPDLDMDSWLDEFVKEADELPQGDPESIPEPPDEPITQMGDLWILGNHRVMCGDATNLADVETLMNGKFARICFTSPPYNMGKNAELGANKELIDSKYANDSDDKTEEEYRDFLIRFTSVAMAHAEIVVVNIQSLANNKISCIEYLHEMRHNFVDVGVWDKGHAAPAMARNVMNSQFEFLYFFTLDERPSRAIRTANFRGTVPNVYMGEMQRNNEASSVHQATFPSHLPEWAVKTLTEDGDVYDPFIGSGTTLIASENQRRGCFGMEIDPKYVDVTVKRWEQYTGKTAVLETDNKEKAAV